MPKLNRLMPGWGVAILLGLSSIVTSSSNGGLSPALPNVTVVNASDNGFNGFTPQQVQHAYGFDQIEADGRGETIAVVSAMDHPDAAANLARAIAEFHERPMYGLPGMKACSMTAGPYPCFEKVLLNRKGESNSDWDMETDMDLQWAHAIAPGANILLVEAVKNTIPDLIDGAIHAADLGAQVVSMSWGDYEFPAYLQYDALFNRPGVVFVASTGDEPLTTQYPATSPYVLAVGGTNVDIAPNGTWKSESVGPGWGGGSSTYEHDSLANGHLRLTPDVSYGAELAFPVYGTINGSGTPNWYLDGGTSGSAPQWAALVARVDQLRSGHPFSSMELRQALAAAGAPPVYEQNFHEIVGHGDPQICPTCTATPGFNVSTGYGSPIANHLIPFLATYGFPKSVP